jgi:hypothetical protein
VIELGVVEIDEELVWLSEERGELANGNKKQCDGCAGKVFEEMSN